MDFGAQIPVLSRWPRRWSPAAALGAPAAAPARLRRLATRRGDALAMGGSQSIQNWRFLIGFTMVDWVYYTFIEFYKWGIVLITSYNWLFQWDFPMTDPWCCIYIYIIIYIYANMNGVY